MAGEAAPGRHHARRRASSIYLVWAELFRIEAICLWCTGVHVVTLALFFVVVLDAALRPIEEDSPSPSGVSHR